MAGYLLERPHIPAGVLMTSGNCGPQRHAELTELRHVARSANVAPYAISQAVAPASSFLCAQAK